MALPSLQWPHDRGSNFLLFCVTLCWFNWLCKRGGCIYSLNTNRSQDYTISVYGVTVYTPPSICYVHQIKLQVMTLRLFLWKINAACSQVWMADSGWGVDRWEGKAPHKSAPDICCYLLLIYSTTLVYYKYFPKIITSYDKAIPLSKGNSPDNMN